METITSVDMKIDEFAKVLEIAQIQRLKADGLDCEANINLCKTKVLRGGKYTKVNVGGSGKYMVVNATGDIYGVKAYGVIHKGHHFGTVDTIGEWDWGGYVAKRK